jgi:hypothetical protein
VLEIPIYCTTQNAARLGATVSELVGNFPPDTKEVDKTAFSMVCMAFALPEDSSFAQSAGLDFPCSCDKLPTYLLMG